jgi:stalled ribosome rescue protein Dom34
MTTQHAVVRIDHQTAEILHFDTEHVESHKVKTHTHHTAQHGSGVRSQHEFFGQVCDALAGTPELMVAGSRTAQADFRHYVEKHRPALIAHILAYATVDHPTTPQLVALARQEFLKIDRLSGSTATP